MIRINFIILNSIFVLFFLMNGCKKDPVSPPPPPAEEDYSFPADTSKFAVTLFTNNENINLGNQFDVKLIYYNVQDVFGTAVEIVYDKDKIEIIDESKLLIGPFFKTGDSTLVLKKVEQNYGRANLGISYVKGSDLYSSGSGVILKIKAKAIAKGTVAFSVNHPKLKILKSSGEDIDNFQNINIEDLTLNVQ